MAAARREPRRASRSAGGRLGSAPWPHRREQRRLCRRRPPPRRPLVVEGSRLVACARRRRRPHGGDGGEGATAAPRLGSAGGGYTSVVWKALSPRAWVGGRRLHHIFVVTRPEPYKRHIIPRSDDLGLADGVAALVLLFACCWRASAAHDMAKPRMARSARANRLGSAAAGADGCAARSAVTFSRGEVGVGARTERRRKRARARGEGKRGGVGAKRGVRYVYAADSSTPILDLARIAAAIEGAGSSSRPLRECLALRQPPVPWRFRGGFKAVSRRFRVGFTAVARHLPLCVRRAHLVAQQPRARERHRQVAAGAARAAEDRLDEERLTITRTCSETRSVSDTPSLRRIASSSSSLRPSASAPPSAQRTRSRSYVAAAPSSAARSWQTQRATEAVNTCGGYSSFEGSQSVCNTSLITWQMQSAIR